MRLSFQKPQAVLGITAALVLSACAWRGDAPPAVLQKPASQGLHFSPQDKALWEPVALPGKLRTAFRLEKRDQRPALLADAQSSASMLRQRLNIPPRAIGPPAFRLASGKPDGGCRHVGARDRGFTGPSDPSV